MEQLTADQILEVRHLVADTREGFAWHLQKLSKALNDTGSGSADLRREAKNVVETDLLPDYAAFRRQISSKRRGWWRRAIRPVSEILKIDAAPWTPKFYGQLLTALGFPLVEHTAEKFESTNERMAFQFMERLKDFAISLEDQPRAGDRGSTK